MWGRTIAVPTAPTASNGSAPCLPAKFAAPRAVTPTKSINHDSLPMLRGPVQHRRQQQHEQRITPASPVGEGDRKARKSRYWPQNAKVANTTNAARVTGPVTV